MNRKHITKLKVAGIMLALAPMLATAGGYSWYRNIYNTSDTSFGLWVENSYQGNYYVTCNGITYKNPSMLTIAPGQTCKTKSTTTDTRHSTYIAFIGRQDTVWHKYNLKGTFAGSDPTAYGFNCQYDLYTKTKPVIDAGGMALNGYPKGTQPIGSSSDYNCDGLKLFSGATHVGYAGGDIWFHSNEPLIGGELIWPIEASKAAIVYNYAPYKISIDGFVSKGGIKLTYSNSSAIFESEEIEIIPDGSSIELNHDSKEFQIDPAKLDIKGNLIPGVVSVDYKKDNIDNTLLGGYHVYNEETHKLIDLDVKNFSIYDISTGGGKFDYWIHSPDGVAHKMRVLLNVAPYEKGSIADAPGSIVVCPVGYEGIEACK
ncbi:hypothetical protein [Aquella oligotrophica]|uniref:Uncharacterized protein n=1 Tax=Aquella oligotrophica TaxID=2067065 RepID=A0A2I7N614_9NEIS|nr:hypothetical protein [Aquella oligotrophica]AUR51880.1 hypothetical protein CUN60_06075 [Aquella oligotrophica]